MYALLGLIMGTLRQRMHSIDNSNWTYREPGY